MANLYISAIYEYKNMNMNMHVHGHVYQLSCVHLPDASSCSLTVARRPRNVECGTRGVLEPEAYIILPVRYDMIV